MMELFNVIWLLVAALLLLANGLMLYHNFLSMRHLTFVLHSFIASQKRFEEILEQERSKSIAPE